MSDQDYIVCEERGCLNPAMYRCVDGNFQPICWRCVHDIELRGNFMRLIPIPHVSSPLTLALLLR